MIKFLIFIIVIIRQTDLRIINNFKTVNHVKAT